MGAPVMIDRFASALLESAERRSVTGLILEGVRRGERQWEGQDLLHIVRRMSASLNDEFYGLASCSCPRGTSALGMEIMVLSRDLKDALQRCFQLYGLITAGMRFHLVEEGDLVAIEVIEDDPSRDPDHFLVEWQSVRWHKLAQWLIGAEIPLVRAEFPHRRQGPLSEYTQVFGGECLFMRPRARFYFQTHFLKRRIVRKIEDLNVNATLKSYDPVYTEVEKSWCKLLKTSLCARLLQMEPMPTMEELATEFGVCSQTLRRRLRAENLTYRRLKAQARREVVMEQICDERISLAQISLMAGFAETNGLARAMKSWTGFSPSQYRKIAAHHIGEPGADQGHGRSGTH